MTFLLAALIPGHVLPLLPTARAPLLVAPHGTHTLARAPHRAHALAQGSHSPVGVLEVDVDSFCRSEELWEGGKGTAC